MLSVTQTEAIKRETLGKPDRPRDEQSLVRGGGFHLSKFASNPTRVGLSNLLQLTSRPIAGGRVDRCAETGIESTPQRTKYPECYCLAATYSPWVDALPTRACFNSNG